MKRLTRREFLKGGVLLGLGALGAATIWRNWRLAGTPSRTERLPFYARPARYFVPVSGSARCGDCHGAPAPAQNSYCHTEHSRTFVKCRLCPKGCLISDGRRGDCRVRENRGGTLYTMAYGNPCALGVDPIEKKPFYHFLPGTTAFSLSTAGCNLHCLYCQNWQISQVPPERTDFVQLLPEDVVAGAQQARSPSIAFTYAEPTVFFEYMVDTARLARARGLRSVVISAGYINPEPLAELCTLVDAIKIDLKGINEAFYREVCSATLAPVLQAIRQIARSGVHLEIVNLVVPGRNDALEDMRTLARWVRDEVGPDVPLHFTRFYPQYRLLDVPPTPVETLERARAIALEEGLHYVYVGNVPGHPGNHTYCPGCGRVVIRRSGFSVLEMALQDGRCAFCGYPIPGVWC
ncbi:MAG: AmmeMemoRadiSam system radical SAM enzyme [Chloroflexia bacterium]